MAWVAAGGQTCHNPRVPKSAHSGGTNVCTIRGELYSSEDKLKVQQKLSLQAEREESFFVSSAAIAVALSVCSLDELLAMPVDDDFITDTNASLE